jgi:hypothetical protein
MFNLGEKVLAIVDGEVTEIRKVGETVKYTVADSSGKEFKQAIVCEEDLSKKGEYHVVATNCIKEGE